MCLEVGEVPPWKGQRDADAREHRGEGTLRDRSFLIVEGVAAAGTKCDQLVPHKVSQRDRGVEVVRADHGADRQFLQERPTQLGRRGRSGPRADRLALLEELVWPHGDRGYPPEMAETARSSAAPPRKAFAYFRPCTDGVGAYR